MESIRRNKMTTLVLPTLLSLALVTGCTSANTGSAAASVTDSAASDVRSTTA